MEFIIIAIVLIVLLLILKYIFNYNMKKIKHIGENKELDELTKKYPSNIEMCKEILRKLSNENVIIEENNDSETSLYIAITNKISIANVKNSYTRIQTIAHECLHSIQDRKMLIFNFIFSNIFLAYFFIICLLGILKILPNKLMFFSLLVIVGFVSYTVRAYLETDAMTRARYLSKEYMEEKGISTKEEINKIVSEFDIINNVGIKAVNYNLLLNIIVKMLIFLLICMFR